MERERLEALQRKASEHYLRGEFAEALVAWKEVLALDPGDEQALEGARLSAALAGVDGPSPARERPQVPGERAEEAAPVELPLFDGAADEEVRRRVDELLGEARSHAGAGRREEAIAALERVRLLEEGNPHADAMAKELGVAPQPSPNDDAELWITEAVQAIESGRPEEARRLLEKVLEVCPGHLEAVHYLAQLERAPEPAPGSQAEAAVPLAAISRPGPAAVAADPAPLDELEHVPLLRGPRKPAAAGSAGPPRSEVAPPRSAGSRSRLLLWVALIAGLAAAAPWAVRRAVGAWTGGTGNAAEAKAPAGAAGNPVPASAPGGQKQAAPQRPAELAPAERLARIEQETARARAAEAAGDYASAVLAWNAVLDLDPANAAAATELRRAGELYRKRKAEREQIEQIRHAFEDGDYAVALKALYRLPPEASGEPVERWKANGWYNLAVVSLRGGDCRQALSHLDELAAIRPRDEGAAEARRLAEKYLEAPKDAAYFARVEGLPFRKLDD